MTCSSGKFTEKLSLDRSNFWSSESFTNPRHFSGDLSILFDPDARQGKGHGIFLLSAFETTSRDACIMAIHGRGILAVSIKAVDAIRLGLGVQGYRPRDTGMPYYTPSVEAVACTETGISAAERALTMRAVATPTAVADTLTSPGHVMVQVVRDVFRDQATLSELGYRLSLAAGADNAIGWCDILDDDGDLAGADHCLRLADLLEVSLFDAREVHQFTRNSPKIL